MFKLFKTFLTIVMILFISYNCFADDYTIAKDFKFGYCSITGNQIIDDNGRALSNYRLVIFELDNGSRMPFPIDVEAVNAITEADYPRIMDWVRAGWMFEINNKHWTPKEIQDYKDTFFNLKIVRRIK